MVRARDKMPGRFEGFVARRLVGAHKRSYVSLVSMVSMWGLALGVASLIVIFAITSGFEGVFRDKILGVYPHLVIIGNGGDLPDWKAVRETLAERPRLTSVAAATYDEMMASHRGRRGGCIVKGIEATNATVAGTVEPFLTEGRLVDLTVEPHPTLTRGRLEPGPLPGGSRHLFLVREDGTVRVEEHFEEASEVPRISLLSARKEPAEVVVPGILTDEEFTLLSGAQTRFMDVPQSDSPTIVRIDGELHELAVSTGDHVVVVGPNGLHTCPFTPPQTSQAPAVVCVVNLRPEPVEVLLPSGSQTVLAGTHELLTEAQGERPRVFIGRELARKIEAQPGDEIRLVSPLYSVPGLGSGRRQGRTIADTFEVAGFIELGFYEYDEKLTLIDFPAARRFLHQGDTARWVEVRVDDIFESSQRGTELGRFLADFSLLDVQDYMPTLVEKYERALETLPPPRTAAGVFTNINGLLGSVKFSNLSGELSFGYQDSYRIITWEEMNKPLFTSMKRQRIVLALFFLIIIVVAAFNIVSSQVMIVREKASDIAILKAMGATNGQVKRIFLVQGMVVGLLGTAMGLALALLVCGLLSVVGFPLDPKVYFVSTLPVNLQWTDVILACTLSLVAIYAAVSFAARRAADRPPVEGLRELD